MLLSRNEILALDDAKRELVIIPEWGTPEQPAEIWITGMSGAHRELYETWAMQYNEQRREGAMEEEPSHLYAKMAVLSVCDEHGGRLFTLGDVPALSRKSYGALKRIFDVAWRLNHFDPSDVEELAKNSVSVQSDGSGSDSLSPSVDAL